MSDTKVDMAKVTQMLDAGWLVRIWKGPMGSYEVRARHPRPGMYESLLIRLEANAPKDHMLLPGMSRMQTIEECHFDDDEVMTDDFTPDQALTRMAYKVHGEII